MSTPLHLPLSRISVLMLAFVVVLASASTTGCGSIGSSGSQSPASGLSGNTSVTVLLSSTANDQLSEYLVSLSSITLTSQSGKTVTLTPTNQSAEFIHLNGTSEPLMTASIPQDVYTSASMASPFSSFGACVNLDSLGGIGAGGGGGSGGHAPVVNVPAPITVTGSAMGLSLNLQVSQSITVSQQCHSFEGSTITFNLEPVNLSTEPTNSENGKETNLDGDISAINTPAASFTLVLADGQTLSFNSNAGTAYQGVSEFSALTVGTFVDMDAAVQSDGSLLATRIAVEDTNTSNLSVAMGPVMESLASQPVIEVFQRRQQGYLFTPGQVPSCPGLGCIYTGFYDSSNAVFQVSGQFTNLQGLPFPARFDVAHIFGGQNVYVTTHALSSSQPEYTPATTITLMPQTINGTVVGSSISGGFQIYSVSLASYDLPPLLTTETQVAQSYSLNNPSTVEVYIDSSTQLLNQQALAMGSLLRFNGLLFDDDGTLRMDCGQVNDGVAE